MMFALAAVAVAAAPVSTPAVVTPATGITPMAERVVRFAALNKRNGTTQEFSAHPGDTLRFATLTIRVRACETTAPWEARQTAAYFQVDDAPAHVRSGAVPPPRRVYSGWMFAESPSLNPLQHPLYDVWVRSCTMRFPDTGPDTLVVGRSSQPPPNSQSKALKSPLPAKASASKTL